MRAKAIRALLCAAGLLGLQGCVTFLWSHERLFEKPPKDALDGCEIGRTTLAECLERLGAPLYVWEYKGDGAAIAWGAANEDSKRIAVTLPFEVRIQPTFSYTDALARLRGPVLFFDKDLVLESFQEGCLRDLRDQARRTRPAPVAP